MCYFKSLANKLCALMVPNRVMSRFKKITMLSQMSINLVSIVTIQCNSIQAVLVILFYDSKTKLAIISYLPTYSSANAVKLSRVQIYILCFVSFFLFEKKKNIHLIMDSNTSNKNTIEAYRLFKCCVQTC